MNPWIASTRRTLRRAALVVLPAVLAACGGGSDFEPPVDDCSVVAQKVWLRDYMADWYFWYRLSPRPDPAAFANLQDYFEALLYTGTDADFPADRWSFTESTESFNRFFGEGRSLGYGVAVAGIEVRGHPDRPLLVRHVEALSPAALAGVRRGDELRSINGRSARDLIEADDFTLLSPERHGETITLLLRRDGVDRSVTLVATDFQLTPVPNTAVVTSPLGRRIGYVVVKDMITQALAPLEGAFASFRAQGVQDVVLDLRYNGGGLVSVASTLASYAGGSRSAGRPFATLLYNDRHAASNATTPFASLASALDLPRVYVLTGPRTCSASEQVINGLSPFVQVVTIGDTTCGKPVGYLPASQCGTTYNVVNFETVNARNEGRYFDGFDASCPVAEDLAKPLGAPDENLLAVAATHADSGACATAGSRERPLGRLSPLLRKPEPGERRGMIAR